MAQSHADNLNGSKQGALEDYADPFGAKLPFLPEEADLKTFSRLFNGVVRSRKPEKLIPAVTSLRNFVEKAAPRYESIPTALAMIFLEASDISCSAKPHIWQVLSQLQDLYKAGSLESRTMLTNISVCEAGWLFMDANKRCPTEKDGLILSGDLADGVRSWQDIVNWLAEKVENTPMTLGEFFCHQRVFVYMGQFKGILTHEIIIATGLAEKEATGRRPTDKDFASIAFGPLAATGLSWKAIDESLRRGWHGLPGDETLATILDQAGIPGARFSGVLTHEIIIATAWAEKVATGRRPTCNDSDAITFGPLAGTGLSCKAVDFSLRDGFHGLPGKENLSFILDNALIPKGKLPIHLDLLPPELANFINNLSRQNWDDFSKSDYSFLRRTQAKETQPAKHTLQL